jgi:hypothetical protein
MTYSPSHVTPAQRVEELAAKLVCDVADVLRLADLACSVADTRGQRPPVDPDNIGRRGSAGPGRPTEDIALDDARLLVVHEQTTAVQHMIKAVAYVRGAAAALDRALSEWEGEPYVPEGARYAAGGNTATGGDEDGLPDRAHGDGGGAGIPLVDVSEAGGSGGGSGSRVDPARG